jgi:hypothetical protein
MINDITRLITNEIAGLLILVGIPAFAIGVFISPITTRDSELETKAKAVIQVCEEHLPRDQHCELKAEPAKGEV